MSGQMRSNEVIERELVKCVQLLWYHEFLIQFPPSQHLFAQATESVPKLVVHAKSKAAQYQRETANIGSYDLMSRDILYGRYLALAWPLEISYPDFKRACLKKMSSAPIPEDGKNQGLLASFNQCLRQRWKERIANRDLTSALRALDGLQGGDGDNAMSGKFAVLQRTRYDFPNSFKMRLMELS